MKIDIIGDVHGCYDELMDLFKKLGYSFEDHLPKHASRVPVFLGDLTDRGPKSIEVMRLVYKLVIEENRGKYIPGNHCNKLYRFFLGNPVKQQHGLETTVAEWEELSPRDQKEVKEEFITLYETAPLYLQLPEVNAVVAHAGIKRDMIGKKGKRVETFVFYGDITGKTLPNGMPERLDWAEEDTGGDWIIYGHTPVREPRVIGKTMNIDTGCVFGGKLTAFQLPEENIVSVPSYQEEVPEKFKTFDA
ncbi:bis(5'-nucleosyl)-tetraphosphatase PrpE [Bacillaceae bacterium S4-13-58]